MVILAKIVKILRKLSRLRPQGVSWGVRPKFFLAIMIHLVEMYLFCDKTFVVRPTSDPKKLKFMKIPLKLVENRQNTPLGPFLGVPPKFFFYKMLHRINMNVFQDKSFALKSKIKNFKIFRMLMALKNRKSAKSGTMDRMIFGEFAIFHSQGPPGRENHGGTRSMGGVQYPPFYLPHYQVL